MNRIHSDFHLWVNVRNSVERNVFIKTLITTCELNATPAGNGSQQSGKHV